MPPTYGITPLGFVSKDTETVLSEIDTGLKAILGDSAGTELDGSIPLDSMAGQLKTLIANKDSAFWDLALAIVARFDPTQADDEGLDNLAAITGATRDGAIDSTVVGTCCGTPNTVLLVGRVATVTGTGTRFDSLAAILPGDPNYPASTITAVAAWQSGHDYVVGDRVTNDTPAKVYQCITAGHSAGSGGPTGTNADITDNTAHWQYIGTGSGAVDVEFQAEVAGALFAGVGALAGIATPVSGWSTVKNLAAAALGQIKESDPAFRVRREAELAGDGEAIADAIRAKLLKVGEGTSTPVTSCTVFQNQTMAVDGNGLPPKSVEVLIERDSSDPDPDVALAVWNVVGAGAETYGGHTATIVDAAGRNQTVKYSRPTAVPIYVDVAVTYDPKVYPADDVVAGGLLIKQAIALFGASYIVGYSVRSDQLDRQGVGGPPTIDGTPTLGILKVTHLYIGTAPAPGTAADVAIAARQRATFSTANIAVTLTPGTP